MSFGRRTWNAFGKPMTLFTPKLGIKSRTFGCGTSTDLKIAIIVPVVEHPSVENHYRLYLSS